MRDVLLEGLPVLDLLEVLPSTTEVAALIGCDQSSISRIYRYVSERLDLGFNKTDTGEYQASTNRDVLNDLRRVSQRLRLREAQQLRIVGQYWNEALLEPLHLVGPLSRQWFGLAPALAMLRARVVDLVVVNTMDLGINGLLLKSDAKAHWLHRDLAGFSICHYPIKPLAHPDHPLRKKRDLQHNDLWSFPSPALADEAFPHFAAALKERGLWQDKVAEGAYRLRLWEGRCKDRKTLAYHTPLIEHALNQRLTLPLRPLDLDLGLQDLEAVICLSDVAKSSAVLQSIHHIREHYRKQLQDAEDLTWLF